MKWLIVIPISLVLFRCTEIESEVQSSSDSMVKETDPFGDTVLIRYPDYSADPYGMVGYYMDGTKCREAHIHKIDSVEIMDAIWYYPNGQIWKYKLYAFNFLRYYRDYDESGNVIHSKGHPFTNVDSVNELVATQTGYMERLLRTATIPHCRISILVSDYDIRNDTTQNARDHSSIFELHPPDEFYPVDLLTRDPKTQYVFWLIEDTLTGSDENGYFVDRFVFE